MQNLYQQYLVSGPAEYVKELFKNMSYDLIDGAGRKEKMRKAIVYASVHHRNTEKYFSVFL